MKILIVYHSDYGSTEKLARAIAAGAAAAVPEATITLRQVLQTEPEELPQYDVLVFGTPVHMGTMCWQMKRFIDRTSKLWLEGTLEGKIGGVFATGGGYGGGGGGVEQTLIALHAHFLEHGMIVVGFPKSLPGYADGGLHWGLYGRTGDHEGMPVGVSEGCQRAARSYGMHLAEIAQRWIS
ncbi:MAG: Trp repressor-binding protein [Zetaproteobacteria bacterium]|nr:MAG: Trp repressor-binding protein [Zetaproteobacteria bacterium]